MSLTSQLLAALLIIVTVSVLISASKSFNIDSVFTFVWGDQKIKMGQCAHLITSTAFAMNGIMYFLWLGFSVGYAALILQVFWCGSYLWLASHTRRIKSLSGYGTLHGGLGHVFGPRTAILAAVASIIGFAITLGWELSLGASIFRSIAGTNETYADFIQLSFMACMGIAVAFYTGGGGIRGNINANIAQNYLATASLFIAMAFLFWHGSHTISVLQDFDEGTLRKLIDSITLFGVISNVVFSILFQFVDMSAWQNIAATESDGEKQERSLKWAAGAIFLFPGVIGTVIGIQMRDIPGIDPNNIVMKLVEMMVAYPWILIPTVVGFFAAMMSTLDGLALAGSQSITWDIFQSGRTKRLLDWHRDPDAAPEATIQDEQGALLRWMRVAIFGIVVIGAGLAAYFQMVANVNLFDLIYVAFSAQLSLIAVVMVVLRAKEGTRVPDPIGALSIALGLVSGAGAVIYFIATKRPELVLWGPIAAVIGAAFVAVFIRPSPVARSQLVNK